MRKLLASVLALGLCCPCAARPSFDLSISSPSVRSRPEHSSIGLGVGLKEGKPLEMMLWGGEGAIIGTAAGPLGTVVGAAAGALVGLLVSIFAVPHNGPEPGDRK